ncbi:hypothetical protein LJC24_00265 [Desulfococcaceae bacterium OttesenSCG-928-F15]|nr:hypothetical protein [Desulfococcaceae bacterium OttesenSCG-928-F15]
MNSALFGDLPLVTSETELEDVKAANPELDPYFVASGCILERRKLFEVLWPAFKPYADPHFLSDLRKHFHQRTWEMYLGNVLVNKGSVISSSPEGPDFVVNDGLYLECIAPTKGNLNNKDAVPEIHYTRFGEKPCAFPLPEREILLRITQAIKEKADKHYNKWRKKSWFRPDLPYVIAINIGDLEHPENPKMPYVVKALFGVSHMYVEFVQGTNYSSYGWQFRNEIQRGSGSSVAVDCFMSSCLSHVSGVLFSNDTVLNHLVYTDRECLFVNNPFTENLIPLDFVSYFNGWEARREGENIILKKML